MRRNKTALSKGVVCGKRESVECEFAKMAFSHEQRVSKAQLVLKHRHRTNGRWSHFPVMQMRPKSHEAFQVPRAMTFIIRRRGFASKESSSRLLFITIRLAQESVPVQHGPGPGQGSRVLISAQMHSVGHMGRVPVAAVGAVPQFTLDGPGRT